MQVRMWVYYLSKPLCTSIKCERGRLFQKMCHIILVQSEPALKIVGIVGEKHKPFHSLAIRIINEEAKRLRANWKMILLCNGCRHITSGDTLKNLTYFFTYRGLRFSQLLHIGNETVFFVLKFPPTFQALYSWHGDGTMRLFGYPTVSIVKKVIMLTTLHSF